MIPEDYCPKCAEQTVFLYMERGITEYGQMCPECLHHVDDPFWAMQGEYLDEDGEPTPNPREAEVMPYRIKRFMVAYRELCKKHGLFYGAMCGHDGEAVHPEADLILEDEQAIKQFKEMYDGK